MANKLNISDSERRRRSELARNLNAAGKFGGAQPGSGRPSTKKRASEKAAEAIAGMADEIIEAMRAGLASNQPASVRVNTAKEALKMERDHVELTMKEERQLEAMSTAQMIDHILSKIGRVAAAGALPAGFADIMDAESVEEETDGE